MPRSPLPLPKDLSDDDVNALMDLLSVKALSDVSPVRVQQWQTAARNLLDIRTESISPPSPTTLKSPA